MAPVQIALVIHDPWRFLLGIPPCFSSLGFTLIISFARNSVFPRRGFTVLLLSWRTTYVLVYVDDVLHLNHNPDTFMNRLAEVYKLKDDSVGEPDRYLGAKIEKVQLDDGSGA